MPARKIAQGFKEISTTHLECRSLMHAWNFIETHVMKGGILQIKLQCMRCTTYRYDQVERFSGEVIRRQYVYPSGYNVDDLPNWGGRKEFNWNVRRELIRRWTQK
jgi:hypothetical protein